MATLTVRNVPEVTVRKVKIAAAQKGKSMEAELRSLIDETYSGPQTVPFEEVQRRFAAMWGGKPPGNMVDRFLAERHEDFDD